MRNAPTELPPKRAGRYFGKEWRAPVFEIEHHLSHAAAAFYPSPFDDAALMTVDAVGEWTTTALGHGMGRHVRLLGKINFPHGIGLFYTAMTVFCGFRANSGEYKLMGLAPYGSPTFLPRLRETAHVDDDGAVSLDMRYFTHLDAAAGLPYTPRLAELLGVPPRAAESEPELSQVYADIAASTQALFEHAYVETARTVRQLTRSDHLCIAGGGALNCTANGLLVDRCGYKSVWPQPAATDAGSSLGAAQYVWHEIMHKPRHPGDQMGNSYLGPEYSDASIERMLRALGITTQRMTAPHLAHTIAQALAAGRVVALFSGRHEFGPRALGNRSILADPRTPQMRERLNRAVKKRETFRPFAPVVQEEHASTYFRLSSPTPYMLFSRETLPEHRATLAAVTHIDGSARVQTVAKEANPRLWLILEQFRQLTGLPVLVNTSFNVRGEPIVGTPEDALNTARQSGLDHLALGTFWVDLASVRASTALSPRTADATD